MSVFEIWLRDMERIHGTEGIRGVANALTIRLSYFQMFARFDAWIREPGRLAKHEMPTVRISATTAHYFHKILWEINAQNNTAHSLTDHFGVVVIVGKGGETEHS